ncbi:MAG: class I SAM-dependent methyltransferase [Candidatus Binatia bacterium]
MAVAFASRDIAEKYDRFAHWFDCVEGIPDLLGLSSLRQQILQQASGKVLEVAVGTGKNLPYYSKGCRIIGVDISRQMLAIAQRRASRLQLNPTFLVADAAALPFSDNNFDTVLSSLSMCTFPNPVAALREMARVCRIDGKVLLLEHGRSDREWLGQWQDRHANQFAKPLGCHWNREPLKLVRQTGLKIYRAKRHFFGIFHQIESLKMAPQPESRELS